MKRRLKVLAQFGTIGLGTYLVLRALADILDPYIPSPVLLLVFGVALLLVGTKVFGLKIKLK